MPLPDGVPSGKYWCNFGSNLQQQHRRLGCYISLLPIDAEKVADCAVHKLSSSLTITNNMYLREGGLVVSSSSVKVKLSNHVVRARLNCRPCHRVCLRECGCTNVRRCACLTLATNDPGDRLWNG